MKRSVLTGACVVFEKVLEETPWSENLLSSLYRKYKLTQNFTPNEILAKEASLKCVLIPLTQKENFELFSESGFREPVVVMKKLHFEGYLLWR